jgi:hypothetical protein
MSGPRNRSAWIWVAIAAVAFASVARAEAELQSAKVYAHPVLAFLAKSQGPIQDAKPGIQRSAQSRSARSLESMLHSASAGAWVAIVPVYFVGLISPLNLQSVATVLSAGRIQTSPLLPAAFQRPPPCLA